METGMADIETRREYQHLHYWLARCTL